MGEPLDPPESTVVRYFSDAVKASAQEGTVLLSAELLHLKAAAHSAVEVGEWNARQLRDGYDECLSLVMHALATSQ